MNRNEMINFALVRMRGFALERSNNNDNRTIFSVVKMLIESANDTTLEDCRKPLVAVLSIKTNSNKSNEKFLGCKLSLLKHTIVWIFGDSDTLLKAEEFIGFDQRQLLECLEICRRIFVSNYLPKHPGVARASVVKAAKAAEPKYESDIARELKKWQNITEGGSVK